MEGCAEVGSKDVPVLLVSNDGKENARELINDGDTLFQLLHFGVDYSGISTDNCNMKEDTQKLIDKEGTSTISEETLVNIDVNSDLLEEYMEVFVTYRCKECAYVSNDQKEFHHHCLQHLMKENARPSLDNVTYIYLCSKCSKAFNSSEETKQHMISEHELKSNSFKCSEISEVVKINVSIETAENKKTQKEVRKKKRKPQEIIQSIDPAANINNLNFSCTKRNCNYKFSNEEDLNIHEKCHIYVHAELGSCMKKLFQCFMCKELFNDWHGCCSHLYRVHEIDCDLLKCPICETYRTSIPLRLENHIRIHSDVRAFTCKQCGKTFKQASQLRNHCATHKDKNSDGKPEWSRSKQCNICFKMYSDSKSLKKHKEEVHSRLRPFVCNICGHASARKSMLVLHQRQHTGQKPFECCICNFRTADHNSLRKHIMRHTGVRPYKCPHCDYTAIQSGSYKNHMKVVHPNKEGMFVCNVCLYKTISEDNHVRHISDHLTGLIKDNLTNGVCQKTKLTELGSSTATDIISASLFRSGVALDEEKAVELSDEFSNDNVTRPVEDEVIDTGGVTIPAEGIVSEAVVD